MDKKKKHFKIVIRGGYGLGNFGDDALMIELYRILIKKGFTNNNIAFNCYYDAYLHNLIPNINFIHITDNSFTCDNYIYGGGTQFYSFNKNYFSFKKYIKLITKYFIKNLKPKKNKVFALGLGLGPFEDCIKEYDTKFNFIKTDELWLRDTKSLDYCKKWKIKNLNKGTDICNIIKYDNTKTIKSSYKIGLILRDWQNDKLEHYYESVINLIQYLIKNNIEFEPIIFSDRKDLIWEKKLLDIGVDYLKWDPSVEKSYDLFINKLSKFSLMITSRYHGAIFSSQLEIPFITIGVEPKLEMIAELYKNGSFCWKKPYNLTQIIKYINLIKENHDEYKKTIINTNKNNNSEAIKMLDDMLQKLK